MRYLVEITYVADRDNLPHNAAGTVEVPDPDEAVSRVRKIFKTKGVRVRIRSVRSLEVAS